MGARPSRLAHYESEVEPAQGPEVGVRYADHLAAHGHSHTHRCRQVYSVSDAGVVARIFHRDLPGEPEALQAFIDACGIARD